MTRRKEKLEENTRFEFASRIGTQDILLTLPDYNKRLLNWGDRVTITCDQMPSLVIKLYPEGGKMICTLEDGGKLQTFQLDNGMSCVVTLAKTFHIQYELN